MDALTAIRRRRAVRHYTDQSVPDDDVAEVVRLALHAPTGHGAQAWSFIVVRDDEKRAELANLVRRGAGQYFRIFRPPAEGATPKEHAQWATDYASEALGSYRDIPVWVCGIIVPRFSFDDPMMERIERFSDTISVAFAMENLYVAARALGLGIAPTMFHTYFEDEFREELVLDAPVDLIALGRFRQSRAKLIEVFVAEGDLDTGAIVSNEFEIEWPRGSGRMQRFPEIGRAEWVSLAIARERVVYGIVPVVEAAYSRMTAAP